MREVVAADHDRDMTSLLREVEGGLAGGVAATDHYYRLTAADPGFEIGGCVVHPGAFEPFEIIDRQTLVACAGRDDHRAGRDLAAVREHDDLEPVLHTQAHDLAWRVQAGTEALRLDRGTRRELLAGDAVGVPPSRHMSSPQPFATNASRESPWTAMPGVQVA